MGGCRSLKGGDSERFWVVELLIKSGIDFADQLLPPWGFFEISTMWTSAFYYKNVVRKADF